MGIFDKIFGSSTKKSTSEVDPYGGLPGEFQQYYFQDATKGSNLIGRAHGTSKQLAGNPQQWQGMSPKEQAALSAVLGENQQAQGLFGQAQTMVSATNPMHTGRDEAASVRALSGENDRGQRQIGMAVGGLAGENRQAQAGLNDARSAIGGDRYRDQYTDNVVDTTLAGMDRNAQREAAARGASVASFGGTSGTRAAVADALSGQLHGMNRAETEAGLRSEAERHAAEYGLKESAQIQSLMESGMSFEEALSNMRLKGAQQGLDMQSTVHDARTGAERFKFEGDLEEHQNKLDEADMLRKLGLSGYETSKDANTMRAMFGEQERTTADKNREARRTSGRDATEWYANIFNSTRGLPNTGGQTTTATAPGPSPFAQALGTASSVASIWAAMPTSDERAKEDIGAPEGSALDKIGRLEPYEYRYKEGHGHTRDRTTGLMAQDIERAGITGAVGRDHNGIRHVDPYPVLATVVQAVRELDQRTKPGAGLG